MAENDRGALVCIVCRNAQNVGLLEATLLREGYRVLVATTQEEFAAQVGADDKIDLALVDLTGFDARIWPLCEQLRTAGTQLLMLAARKSPAAEQTAQRHGASSFLVKPVGVRELLGLIRVMIEG